MVLAGVVLAALAVMVLRLYLTEGLPRIIRNRPHFQFLASYLSYMTKRSRRADNRLELLELLETGVRDLDFDQVRVLRGEETLYSWRHRRPVHPEAPRIKRGRRLGKSGLEVEWETPTHASESYQKYLKLTWDVFLQEVDCQLRALEEDGDSCAAVRPVDGNARTL